MLTYPPVALPSVHYERLDRAYPGSWSRDHRPALIIQVVLAAIGVGPSRPLPGWAGPDGSFVIPFIWEPGVSARVRHPAKLRLIPLVQTRWAVPSPVRYLPSVHPIVGHAGSRYTGARGS